MNTLNNVLLLSLLALPVYAEIRFDSGPLVPENGRYTLPAERGIQAGGNLFHGFTRFSVEQDKTAVFADYTITPPRPVENIISRVTGGEASRIDGGLRSEIQGANLYFLNPAGVMFGKDARIEVDGSLYVSGADYLKFADGRTLSADASEASQFTAAPPAAFGFLAGTTNPGNIEIETKVKSSDGTHSIQLPAGKTLSVTGRTVHLQGTSGNSTVLHVAGGNLQVAAVGEHSGEVSAANVLENNLNGYGAVIMDGLSAFSTVRLDTYGDEQPGNIHVLGNITMKRASIATTLLPDYGVESGSVMIRGGEFFMESSTIRTRSGPDAGQIDIRMTDQVHLDKANIWTNSKETSGGNIFIQGKTLEIQNGTDISSHALDETTAGNISLYGETLSVSNAEIHSDAGVLVQAADSRLDSSILQGRTLSLNGGRFEVRNSTLHAQNRARVDVERLTLGRDSLAQGGLWAVKADEVQVTGDSSLAPVELRLAARNLHIRGGQAGGLVVTVHADDIQVTDSGNLAPEEVLWLHTGTLSIRGGTVGGKQVSVIGGAVQVTDSGGLGASDKLWMRAEGLTVDGIVEGKTIDLDIDTLDVRAAGSIVADAGQSKLRTRQLVIEKGLIAGEAGSTLAVIADTIRITDDGMLNVKPGASLHITTDTLQISDSGELLADDLRLNARDLHIRAGALRSRIIDITTRQLRVEQAGIVEGTSVNLTGEHTAVLDKGRIVTDGELHLHAPVLRLSGPVDIQTTATPEAAGGNIDIKATELTMQQGAAILTETAGDSRAGDIRVQVSQLDLDRDAHIHSANHGTGAGGGVAIRAEEIRLHAGANIHTIALGSGRGGDIEIATEQLELQKEGRITAHSGCDPTCDEAQRNAFAGPGGDIRIEAERIAIQGFREQDDGQKAPSGISTSTFSHQPGGTIRIGSKSAPVVRLQDQASIHSVSFSAGKAGDIVIHGREVVIEGGADIDASNEGSSPHPGGNIVIHADERLSIRAIPADERLRGINAKFGRTLFGNAQGGIYSVTITPGAGGDVQITAGRVEMAQGGMISTGSAGAGDAGNISLTVTHGGVVLDNAAILTLAEQARGGNIDIGNTDTPVPGDILLRNRGTLDADAGGPASVDEAGNITIHQADALFSAEHSPIRANAAGGHGGNLTIENPRLIILAGSPLTATAIEGNGGRIVIKADVFIASGDSVLDVSSEKALDGEVHIDAREYQDSLDIPAPPPLLTDLLESACRPDAQADKVAIHGRGGMADTPRMPRMGTKPVCVVGDGC